MLKKFTVLSMLAAPLLAFPFAGQAAGTPSNSTNSNPFASLAGVPVSAGELAASHGKDVPANSLYATSSGNSAIGNTGAISTTNSVTGNTGLTTVIQNTGNNSLFQTSTVVNITLSH